MSHRGESDSGNPGISMHRQHPRAGGKVRTRSDIVSSGTGAPREALGRLTPRGSRKHLGTAWPTTVLRPAMIPIDRCMTHSITGG
jgi:hypothetical protein